LPAGVSRPRGEAPDLASAVSPCRQLNGDIFVVMQDGDFGAGAPTVEVVPCSALIRPSVVSASTTLASAYVLLAEPRALVR
jgi:hypothetical protein